MSSSNSRRPRSSSSSSSTSSNSHSQNLSSPPSTASNGSPKLRDKEELKNSGSASGYPDIFPPLPPNLTPDVAADADQGTPDSWVMRNPDLVRLTGKHPFNCESRLNVLFDAGFLTPSHLFYVRNHGATPKVDEELADKWTVRVHGEIDNETTFTLGDLKTKFQVVTLPITLVCAGNRRKEQNVVRKSLGFNWGAGGVSTALFTGVYLADVLDYVKPKRGKAKHVIFEGIDQLPNGPYGTSQKLSWAAERSKGMLLSWAMNGLPLEPDHGYPLRVVIPGQIGGRSVKWLNRIEVSTQESQHHLHFWDNKVLPTQVMPEQARAEKHWWYDSKYLITELNTNSAIAQPDHEEILERPSSKFADDSEEVYPVRGYAYAGGGRRVTRVEVSIDEGETWRLADITYPEDLYRAVCYSDPVYGELDLTDRDTCFCWCFWRFDVPLSKLEKAGALMVRAMDEGLSFQQRDMYWNPTGMMNNWWFRVAVHREVSGENIRLRFEHPTLAGVASGGWMERMKAAGQDYLNPSFSKASAKKVASDAPAAAKPQEVSMLKAGVDRKITSAELKAQQKETPWFVVQGQVYDGTAFLKEHPGGADSILLVAGEDATEDFMAIHSPEGKLKLADHHIGTLSGPLEETAIGEVDNSGPFLHKTIWKKVRLTEATRISHDSIIYRFALARPDQPLGLPVGQHVFVRLKRKDTGEIIQRAYTPVSQQNAVGFIDLLIKLYLSSPQFPEGGKMTTGFHQLQIDDEIELKGPLGSFVWEGKGVARWRDIQIRPKKLGLICGGSGITPILQVLRGVLQDEEDKETQIWLLNANKTEADILCNEELTNFMVSHGSTGRYRLHHTLGRPPQNWTFSTGRINDDMLKNHLPPPDDDALVLICGPDSMIKQTVMPGLTRLGWDVPKKLVIF
ncbi:hypothetical protein SISSUDRAFT_1047659 [Sistotremastrum suecicum HHB10207 ss-3]|uniref:Nitrate reductase n=1 Tax=Sistotremastrum suecicum HHB10207 ss-3 TaxID=1314776 RepID=A0A166D272_9AGAM|nr:hypothetical protein SISSUDRAFT_1047659 [Sistotremastrum suecicum HHB10207 ss-3]